MEVKWEEKDMRGEEMVGGYGKKKGRRERERKEEKKKRERLSEWKYDKENVHSFMSNFTQICAMCHSCRTKESQNCPINTGPLYCVHCCQ